MRSQAISERSKFSQAAPVKSMLKAMRVKSQLHWLPQDIRDARNVDILRRKVGSNNKWSQPKKHATWDTNVNAIQAGLPKPTGTHTHEPCHWTQSYRTCGFDPVFPC